MTFFLPVAPVPKSRPRFTRTGRAYTPPKTREAERAYRILLGPHAPREPLSGAVSVEATFVLPKPKSYAKRFYGQEHVRKPDLDNFVKLLLDTMNGTFWHDDSQIAALEASKRYQAEGEQVGIRVTVRG